MGEVARKPGNAQQYLTFIYELGLILFILVILLGNTIDQEARMGLGVD